MGAGDPQEKGSGRGGGTLLGVTDKFPPGACHVVLWESKKTGRVVKSSLAAATFAAAKSLELAPSVQASRVHVLGGDNPHVFCTDCESLFDNLKGGKRSSGNNLHKRCLHLRQNCVAGSVGEIFAAGWRQSGRHAY